MSSGVHSDEKKQLVNGEGWDSNASWNGGRGNPVETVSLISHWRWQPYPEWNTTVDRCLAMAVSLTFRPTVSLCEISFGVHLPIVSVSSDEKFLESAALIRQSNGWWLFVILNNDGSLRFSPPFRHPHPSTRMSLKWKWRKDNDGQAKRKPSNTFSMDSSS